MQFKAIFLLFTSLAVTALATPVPEADGQLIGGSLEKKAELICYCLCSPCTGSCRLCEPPTA